MNRLDRFRFGNTHKRTMKILGFVAVGVFAIALLLLTVIGVFGSRSENVRIVLSDQSNGLVMEGAGFNLEQIPTSNRITNYDFENSRTSHSFTISSADSSYLYFETDLGIETSGVGAGNTVDVYSLDSNGVMGLRFTGSVDSISTSRFGMNNLIVDTDASWMNDPIVATVVSDGIVDAITSSGKLISDLTGDYEVQSFENDTDFVGICSSGVNIYAVTNTGDVYLSVDGRSFGLLLSIELNEDEVKNISAVGSSVVVLTEGGYLWNISNGRSSLLPMEINNEQSDLIGNGNITVLHNGYGLYVSSNCYYFSRLRPNPGQVRSFNIISSTVSAGAVYLLNESNQVIIINDDYSFEVININNITPTMVACNDEGELIVLSNDNNAYLVNEDGSVTDLTTGTYTVDAVFSGANGRLIARSGNNLYLERVFTGLHIVESVPSENVMPGDICIISAETSNIANTWDLYGEGSQLLTALENDNRCLVLSGNSEGVHAVSQLLRGSSNDNFSENSFYRIELNVRGEIDGKLKVWLSGDNIQEGFETEISADKFESKYFVFAVTDSMLSDEDNVRFNISFEGEGQVYIDDVYLGEDRYGISDIPSDYYDVIKSGSPSAIRLQGLNIGCDGFSYNHFFGMYPDSLESSLRLVRDSNSCPWLVIGSNITQRDINSILSYLCGSVSTEYGKLRTDNGTALPWNRQFDRIYIEIGDDINAYCSDVQRGAYVSYVISLFRQSENYVDIRDKVIFIDGMHYDGSSVLSNADYHASDLCISFDGYSSSNTEYMSVINNAYIDFMYDIPRVTSHGAGGEEFISSLSFADLDMNEMDAAGLISSYLNENADYIKMCLFDIPISTKPVDTESTSIFMNSYTKTLIDMISHLSFIRNTQGIYYEVSAPMDSSHENALEEFVASCTVEYLSDRDNRYLIVANSSDTQQQFITEGVELVGNSARICRYSSTGEVLFDRQINRSDLRFTLQPGEIIVITIPND